MISEKTKLKIIAKSTQDLKELDDIINEELNIREDQEINMIEFDSYRNKLMKIYKATPIYESMIKEGKV